MGEALRGGGANESPCEIRDWLVRCITELADRRLHRISESRLTPIWFQAFRVVD